MTPTPPIAGRIHVDRPHIFEDDKDTADRLAILLSVCGHHVKIARSGPEGLKFVLDARPEVIHLDPGLPSINGYEVASRLRATEGIQDALIVTISGYGRASGRDPDRGRH
jgi:CheY-like chemotaxis protein